MKLSYVKLLIPTYGVLIVGIRGALSLEKIPHLIEQINEKAARVGAQHALLDYRFADFDALPPLEVLEPLVQERLPHLARETRYACVVTPPNVQYARAVANLYLRQSVQVGIFTGMNPAAAFLGCELPEGL
jgi:hypothetical protein